MFALLRRWFGRVDRGAAERRARKLLRANLTPQQLHQLDAELHFDVVGGESGRRYRVHDDNLINVEEYDEAGQRVAHLCFLPKGDLVQGDILLAQKIALELFESAAHTVAKRYPTR